MKIEFVNRNESRKIKASEIPIGTTFNANIGICEDGSPWFRSWGCIVSLSRPGVAYNTGSNDFSKLIFENYVPLHAKLIVSPAK